MKVRASQGTYAANLSILLFGCEVSFGAVRELDVQGIKNCCSSFIC